MGRARPHTPCFPTPPCRVYVFSFSMDICTTPAFIFSLSNPPSSFVRVSADTHFLLYCCSPFPTLHHSAVWPQRCSCSGRLPAALAPVHALVHRNTVCRRSTPPVCPLLPFVASCFVARVWFGR